MPGVLGLGLSTGAVLLGIGLALTFVDELFQQTWFQVAVGIVLFGSGVVVVWFFMNTHKTRKLASLNEQLTKTTSKAIKNFKDHNKEHFEKMKNFLEKAHEGVSGHSYKELKQHIDDMALK